jgi:predicted XRE-type DNA-binding protein
LTDSSCSVNVFAIFIENFDAKVAQEKTRSKKTYNPWIKSSNPCMIFSYSGEVEVVLHQNFSTMADTKKIRGQKKEWAKLLFTKEGLSQKEIADKVGVSAVTVNKWVQSESWTKLKQSMLATRETQLIRLYMQLDELNSAIMGREEGKRFPDFKEADSINKLTSSIRSMETDASIMDVVEVAKKLLTWMRALNPDKAVEISHIFDDFVKHLLKT